MTPEVPDPSLEPEGDEPPGGPFPTWGGLYATVVVYGTLTILLLWFLTGVMNVGAAP